MSDESLTGTINLQPFLRELYRIAAVLLAAHPEMPDDLPVGQLVVAISGGEISVGRRAAAGVQPIAVVKIDRERSDQHAVAPVRLILASEVAAALAADAARGPTS